MNKRDDGVEKSKRGGPGRNQGRKPVKQGEKTVTLSMRLTESQREKVRACGGVAWVRDLIDWAEVTSDE